jgi:subtilase family serine protease
VHLVSRSVDPLAAGASSTATIPAGTAAGSYYILAFTDASGTVTEASETNNQRASAIQVSAGP